MNPKRRMQHVRFRNIDELLAYLPEDELNIVERLRELVQTTIPDIAERLSYTVPYYRRHKDMCFIWPGSVSWGKEPQEGWYDFHSLRDLDESTFLGLLVSATDIDDHLHEARRQKR